MPSKYPPSIYTTIHPVSNNKHILVIFINLCQTCYKSQHSIIRETNRGMLFKWCEFRKLEELLWHSYHCQLPWRLHCIGCCGHEETLGPACLWCLLCLSPGLHWAILLGLSTLRTWEKFKKHTQMTHNRAAFCNNTYWELHFIFIFYYRYFTLYIFICIVLHLSAPSFILLEAGDLFVHSCTVWAILYITVHCFLFIINAHVIILNIYSWRVFRVLFCIVILRK